MENVEKVRILQAAVKAAALDGFDFLKWYKKKFNIIRSAKMPEEERVKHMCYLGHEEVLIFDQKFIKAIDKKGWRKFLQTTAISKRSRMYCLWELLFKNSLIEE
jgi:hypothetical protein